ncbi:UTP--glucose-1-phosphate uridylyltransferase-like isoform X1 [Lates japonicus]|uniref:UTP--glucose-1-phosphate uridylyltransferase-like isoform X1 n=1 Tax=Lates japonicus TaxID=270547 RepID=A0AAD3N9U3_LATJO|nr:UTP--glucose-1-phosphate uridylyltransferase-like isoform X1 [Lates japonicus]
MAECVFNQSPLSVDIRTCYVTCLRGGGVSGSTFGCCPCCRGSPAALTLSSDLTRGVMTEFQEKLRQQHEESMHRELEALLATANKAEAERVHEVICT